MSKPNVFRAALWLTSALAMAVPTVAHAQSAGTRVSNAEDDIVVTARRREERQQDVPLAVTAMSAQQLERQNVTNLTQINGRFAGVYVTQSPNGSGGQAPFFSIRGQAQQEVVGLIDASVALYLDEVVVGRMNGANLGFFDLQGVEVARGPQGTLFGRNTAGGAVQVRTHQPTDEFEASLAQTIGNYNLRRTDAMVNIPLGDTMALRIAGLHTERDGYLTDVITGNDIDYQDDNAARVSLLMRPSSTVTNLLTASWSEADDGGTGGFITYAPAGGLLEPNVAAQRALGSIYKTYSGVPQFSYVENTNITDILTIDLNSNLRIKNVVGYREIDVHNLQDLDGTEVFYFPVERVITGDQWSEELQLQGTYDRFSFVTGVYWFQENVDDQAFSTGRLTAGGASFPTHYPLGDPLIELSSDCAYLTATGVPNCSDTWGIAENTSYAIFAQGDYKLTDQFSVTVGVRQTWDERDALIRNRAYQPSVSTAGVTCRFTLDEDNNPATAETRPTLANCQYHGNAEFDELTYNLSANFQATPDMLMYLAHRHGYRPGGFGARAGNQRGGLDAVYKPELVDDIEFGIKADWHPGDMFLRTNLALYYADYQDAQRILQVSQAPPITTAANAQQATIQGAELEVLFRPNRVFDISASYAYTHGEFDEFRSPVGVDYSAQPYPHSPENIFSVTGTFHVPIPENWGSGMSVALTYYHQDEEDTNDYYASPDFTDAGVATTPTQRAIALANNAAQILPAYEIMNMSFEWSEVFGSQVDLTAFVNNLTEEEYWLPYQGINSQYESRTPGDPRTYGMKLKYNFH